MGSAQLAADAAELRMILRYLESRHARSSITLSIACGHCGAEQFVEVEGDLHWVAVVCWRCGTFIREFRT